MSPGSGSPTAIRALPAAPAGGARCPLPAPQTGPADRSLPSRSEVPPEPGHEAGRTSSRRVGVAQPRGWDRKGRGSAPRQPNTSWLAHLWPANRGREHQPQALPWGARSPPLSEAGACPAGGLWGGSAQTSHTTHTHTTRLGHRAPGGRSEATRTHGARRGCGQRASSRGVAQGPAPGLPGTRWVVRRAGLLRPHRSAPGRGQPCSAGPSASLSLLGDSSSGLSGRCRSRKLVMSRAMASTSLWWPMTALWVRGWEKPVEKRSTTT